MTIAPAGPALDPLRLRPALLEALAGWRGPAFPGTVRLLFVAPPAAVRGGFDVAERADGYDEIYLRDVVSQIERVGTPGVVVAVARLDARPRRSDRALCRHLESRLAASPVRLVDFLTVGTQRDWSLLTRRR